MKRPKSEFKNVVTRDGADNIIINLSALPKKANLIIEGMNERSIQFREPKKKIAAQDIFTPSSPSPQVLDPANALINAGLVQLNKISPYLSHLPDTAMAEFLISPKSTATIAGRGLTSHKGLRSFLEDIASIRNIGTNHGIHFNGQALTGMQIFDRPENAPHITYGQAWASEVCIAEQKAFAFKQNVVIPLAIGTLELLRNLKADFQNAGVENNLNARVNEIEAIITKQRGERLILSSMGVRGHYQYTSTESPDNPDHIFAFFFGGERYKHLGSGPKSKDSEHYSSRPIALRVLAPNADRSPG